MSKNRGSIQPNQFHQSQILQQEKETLGGRYKNCRMLSARD